MGLYETIFTRRAVRDFNKTPLSCQTLDGIMTYIADTKQLNGQKADVKIVPATAVSHNKAPHYILAHCKKNDAEYINVGYVLQKADLFIQSLGMGSVWLGIPDPKTKEDKENFCIMLGFGNTTFPERMGADDFNRLCVTDISDTDNEIARAVRLAPSAMNSQPWRLTFTENIVIIDYFGRGLLKGILKHKCSNIDIGIATRHAEIALEAKGKTIIEVTPVVDKNGFKTIIRYKSATQ